MEKKMENKMETGVIWGFKELKLSYSIGETLLFTIYIWMVDKIMVPFWVLIIIRHLVFRVRQKGPLF